MKKAIVILTLLVSAAIWIANIAFKKADSSARYSCLASIGMALQSLTAEELKEIPNPDPMWMILSENDKDYILKLAASKSSLDCFNKGNRILFGHRYESPKIAMRNLGNGVEFALWSKAKDGFFGKSNEVVVFPSTFQVPVGVE